MKVVIFYEYLIWLAPAAVAAGISLAWARHGGGTISWCLFTASCVIALLAFVAAIKAAVETRSFAANDAKYFEEEPPELIEIGSDSELNRLKAAERLRVRAGDTSWAYRTDALTALKVLVNDERPLVRTLASDLLLEYSDPDRSSRRRMSDPQLPKSLAPETRSVLNEVIRLQQLVSAIPEEGERIETAKRVAQEFSLRFQVNAEVALSVARRIGSRDFLHLTNTDDIACVSAEPGVYLYDDTLRVRADNIITVNLFKVLHTSFGETRPIQCLGVLGRFLLEAA